MENGDHFIQFYSMNNFMIGSSMFQHKDTHKITWVSNDHRTATQTDHCAISPGLRIPCLQDFQPYRGADVCCAYHLAIPKLKINLKRQMNRTLQPKRFDIAKLKNSEFQKRFQASIQNCFDVITEHMPGSTECSDELKAAMRTAGKDILR